MLKSSEIRSPQLVGAHRYSFNLDGTAIHLTSMASAGPGPLRPAHGHLLGERTRSSNRGVITHLFNRLGMLANHYVIVVGSGVSGFFGLSKSRRKAA